MDDLISRQAAIDAIRAFYDEYIVYDNGKSIEDLISELPSAQPEPFTDEEKRIFLAAIWKEEKVCWKVDRNCMREPHEVRLMHVCREIIRKVKGALWT